MQRSVPETGSWCLQLELNSRKGEKTDLTEVFFLLFKNCFQQRFGCFEICLGSFNFGTNLISVVSEPSRSLFGGHFEMCFLYKGLNKNKSKGHLVESRSISEAVRIFKYSVKL